MLRRTLVDRVGGPLAGSIGLRPASAADEPFLYRVYASTREEDDFSHLHWDQAQKAALLELQFAAQYRSYRENFPGACYDLIVLDQALVGRLLLHAADVEIRVVDIGLLPEYHNRGIGTAIMRAVLEEATETGQRVRLSVECSNRALRLYQRLGFNAIHMRGIHIEMEWAPGSHRFEPPGLD